MRRAVEVSREVLLTTAAVLGSLCLVATVAAAAFGIRPLLFRSGSMSPTISTGDLAFAQSVPAAALRPGDIVSVHNAAGERVTHRLVSAARQGAARRVELKGDANRRPDTERYNVTRADRVLFHVPWLGYAVAAATGRAGIFILGLYVALLLSVIFRRRGRDEDGSPPPRRRGRSRGRRVARRRRSGLLAARSVSVAALAGVLAWSGPAWSAPWTDPVPITAPVRAAVVGAPTISCSGGGLLSSPTISWPLPSGPTPASYLVTYANGGNVQTATTTSRTWQLPGSAVGLLATYTITVQSVLGTWQSVPSNQVKVQVTSVLFLGLVSSCV